MSEATPSAARLTAQLVRLRWRTLWNGVKRNARGRVVALFGLIVPAAYVGLFATAFAALGRRGGAWQETALFNKYAGGSIPFVDFGNQYLVPQAQYLPSALQGMSWSQVAAAMRTPSSPVAKDIDGAANITVSVSDVVPPETTHE